LGKADLHIHTTASDGAAEPADIVDLAVSKSLNTISITDHDTIEGYRQAKASAESHAIHLIPGVEFTARHGGREIHLLSYNFNPGDREILDLLKRQRLARRERMEKILDNLRSSQGLDLEFDEVKAYARSSSVGRPHVARLMVKKRMVSSVSEAFIRYLGSSVIETFEVPYASVEEIASVTGDAGGVTILAHPGPLYSLEEVEDLVNQGLDGVECIHPAHDYNKQKMFIEFAESRHLLITGGSDFHGSGEKYDPWFGIVTVSETRVRDLERISKNRCNLNRTDIGT